jgi:tRNA dimethylallyltransferase
MLYFRSLFRGIAQLPVADAAVRAELDARAARDGWPALHAVLALRDPAAAARIHVHDAQRIQRALEVLQVSGRSMSEHWEQQAPAEDFSQWQIIALEPADRLRLHAVLDTRLRGMLATGMVDEVRRLLQRPGISPDSPAMRLVGYRQLLDHCQGRQSLAQAAERALHATRQLAKRQMTWLRSATFVPDECRLIRIDAFDDAARERLAGALIKTTSPP